MAILFDWDNRWAIDDMQGPRNIGMHYKETVQEHYQAFYEMGIPVDFVDMNCDLTKYKVFVAPMMYMLKNGFENKIKEFVANGGTFVTTYWSGIVNETDLCFLEGTPHGLMDVIGLRSEEIDGLFDGETNSASSTNTHWLTQKDCYTSSELCELVIPSTAKALMTYNEDFYQGMPALTSNQFGKGQAFYIATRFEESFYHEFYSQLVADLNLITQPDFTTPKGVIISTRDHYRFIQNFNNKEIEMDALPTQYNVVDTEKDIYKNFTLKPYEVLIVKS